MTKNHGHKKNGMLITEELVKAMANEAEAGYDVEEILRRRGGRPKMGSTAASVESVRLDPELERDLVVHAAEQPVSVSEAIRRAIRRYLHAS